MHVKWRKVHSEQESCMRTKGEGECMERNFRLVSALSATFLTNSTFEHFNSGICAQM